jgi:hypothetical protein
MRTTRWLAVITVVAAVLLHAGRAPAVYHLAVIDEVMTSYNGDPNVQFIEIRMLAGLQSFTANSVFAVFGPSGDYVSDLLVVPGNLPNMGADVRWLVGTSAFQTASGVTPDFVIPAGMLPAAGGMVCYGGGGTTMPGLVPENPPDWDRTNFPAYVDCLAYGNYSGPTNVKIGTPTSLSAEGHALQRTQSTGNNAADFVCADPATPKNNAGATDDLAATSPCGGNATPTPTVTGVPTGTVSACVGDCDDTGRVTVNELVRGVNISLGLQPLSSCESFDCQHNGMVGVNCLIQGVNNSLDGCPAPPTVTPVPGDGTLGLRHFSIDPEKSSFTAVIGEGAGFPFYGFEGFLDFKATGNGSIVFLDLTDASDYLQVNLPLAGTAVCLKILKDQLPIHNAGLLSCGGNLPLGIKVTQDHDIGVVGRCSGGDNAGNACSDAGDCPGGKCFAAEDCTAAGGRLEDENHPHPGVCNGPIVGVQDTEASPPGTLVLAPDPNGIVAGIPIELSQEASTPCGDEGAVGMPIRIGFTTGRAFSEVFNYNDIAGATLTGDPIVGMPFDCAHFSEENGPGTLVLSATNLDTPIAGQPGDILAQFYLVD